MKKSEKIIATFISSFILFILYFLFFPYETEKELCVQPRIVHYPEQSDISLNNSTTDQLYSFRIGNLFGFLDKDGALYHRENVLYNVAISDYGYINYSSIQDANQSLVLKDPLGNFIQSFYIPGYPFYSEDGTRLFIIKTDATGIREVTTEGDELWKADFASLITSFSSNNEYTLIGLLNGLIKVYTKAGECIYNYKPESGRLSVVYGTAISNDSKTMAILSGLNPQHLFFFKKGNANYHHPLKKEIQGELRRPALLTYSYNDKFLLYETLDNLNTMDLKTLKTYSFPLTGRLTNIDTHKENQFVIASFLETGLPEQTDICLLKPRNLMFIKHPQKIKIDFLRFIHNRIILGFNETVVVLVIKEV